jgi:hypothetical protein
VDPDLDSTLDLYFPILFLRFEPWYREEWE